MCIQFADQKLFFLMLKYSLTRGIYFVNSQIGLKNCILSFWYFVKLQNQLLGDAMRMPQEKSWEIYLEFILQYNCIFQQCANSPWIYSSLVNFKCFSELSRTVMSKNIFRCIRNSMEESYFFQSANEKWIPKDV